MILSGGLIILERQRRFLWSTKWFRQSAEPFRSRRERFSDEWKRF